MSPPVSFAIGDRTTLMIVHAEGAQLYECKAEAGSDAAWVFREPIATLMVDGKTVGRHYLGPNWELIDGSAVKAKTSASAPGATADDVPLLKLEVVEHRGAGRLAQAALVLRLNTHGGALKGSCGPVGTIRAQPYSADYIFLL